ncbi:MAG: ABC-2 family transporter protein [Parcubacteria group bacterium]|jgi:ABC-2 type transport system permease protein
MKKYWSIIRNEIQRQFTYRIAIAAYAFGNIAELVALAIIWTVVYQSIEVVKGYNASEMISYVVFAWFFSFLTTTYAFEANVARDIHMGTLSNILVKPMGYLKYMMTVATGRIFVALLVVLIQVIIVFYFFWDKLIFSIDFPTALLLAAMLVVSYLINLLLSILIGFIGFWTAEIAGIYLALKIIKNFLSGFYFPINLLPATLVKISLFFPFAYTAFIPIQLYLGKISFAEGLRGLAVEIVWLVILYGIIKIVWRFGLKKYESVGI